MLIHHPCGTRPVDPVCVPAASLFDHSPPTLTLLFLRHRQRIYRYCLTYLQHPTEAEDATMEIFECLMRQPDISRIYNLPAWLSTVSRNHCLRKLEQRAGRLRLQALVRRQRLWEDDTAEEKLLREIESERLRSGLDQLTDAQSRCLWHFYVEHQPYKKIAHLLGLPPRAVKSHIQNGKRRLRKWMKMEGLGGRSKEDIKAV